MNQSNGHLPLTDAISNFKLNHSSILLEYCQLASKECLSTSDEDRMSEILELAESDGVLDFWLNEADHFLAHELNLTNKESIYKFENQLANLREHLEHQLIENEKLDLFEELRHHLKHASQELQEHLKNRGFDPGPIDGILGPRTHSALIAFQQANQLIPNGLPDAVTREALGLK